MRYEHPKGLPAALEYDPRTGSVVVEGAGGSNTYISPWAAWYRIAKDAHESASPSASHVWLMTFAERLYYLHAGRFRG